MSAGPRSTLAAQSSNAMYRRFAAWKERARSLVFRRLPESPGLNLKL